jgi:hypothetical protein
MRRRNSKTPASRRSSAVALFVEAQMPSSLDRRLADLERSTPQVQPRPEGTTFEAFTAAMVADLVGVPAHAIGKKARPWLAAMTHSEVVRLMQAIDEHLARGRAA